MPIYTYTARDNKGQSRTGTVDARTEALAVSLLKDQGLFVVTLTEKRTSILDQLTSIRGVPDNDIVAFTRQLSTMISAGLPISRALEVLSEQSPNPKMKKIIMDSLRDIEGGSSLSTALGRYPKVFPQTYQSLVMAGEASGKLDEVLLRLADTMEKQRELRSKFKAAMVYPAIVFVVMIGVFVLMMVFVIPKLADMYESLNVDLPPITKFMITVSDLFVQRYYIVLVAVAGLIFAIKTFVATEGGKELLSKLSFTLPVFGKINKQKELSEFTRTLSLLVASAIPIVEALHIVARAAKNSAIKRAAIEAANSVEKGNALSEYLRANKIFPPLLGQMAAVGEETGQLDEVLDKVADFFGGETDHAVQGLSSALEPIILLMLGGMVGLLIVSIITPIYQITSSL
ncbi:MAG: type II secretion system F family protein [Patescibacteria group bacterium]